MKLKKQVESIQQAEKAEESANKMADQKSSSNNSKKPPKAEAIKRPNTTAMNQKVFRPFTGATHAFSMNITGGRAASANNAQLNPKLRRFENVIGRLKKILETEKKNLRQIKTLCAKEIDQKNQLEKILRQCVDDVKTEITRKKTESKVQIY